MKDVKSIVSHAEQQCRSRGTRLTKKRTLVLESLLESEKALSAYELIDLCRENHGEALPAMSMYRILDFLQEEQLVHRLNLANKYVACSHITCNHEHAVPQFLICSACQKVTEISISKKTIKELQKNVEDAQYHLVTPQLEMNCLCSDCVNTAA